MTFPQKGPPPRLGGDGGTRWLRPGGQAVSGYGKYARRHSFPEW